MRTLLLLVVLAAGCDKPKPPVAAPADAAPAKTEADQIKDKMQKVNVQHEQGVDDKMKKAESE